jgi:hypothetical protein
LKKKFSNTTNPSIGFPIFIVLSAEPLAKSPYCKTVKALILLVCPFKVSYNDPKGAVVVVVVVVLVVVVAVTV